MPCIRAVQEIFIPLYLTPEIYWRNWTSQKHMMRYPNLYEQQSKMYDEFKEEYYDYKNEENLRLNKYIERLKNQRQTLHGHDISIPIVLEIDYENKI